MMHFIFHSFFADENILWVILCRLYLTPSSEFVRLSKTDKSQSQKEAAKCFAQENKKDLKKKDDRWLITSQIVSNCHFCLYKNRKGNFIWFYPLRLVQLTRGLSINWHKKVQEITLSWLRKLQPTPWQMQKWERLSGDKSVVFTQLSDHI